MSEKGPEKQERRDPTLDSAKEDKVYTVHDITAKAELLMKFVNDPALNASEKTLMKRDLLKARNYMVVTEVYENEEALQGAVKPGQQLKTKVLPDGKIQVAYETYGRPEFEGGDSVRNFVERYKSYEKAKNRYEDAIKREEFLKQNGIKPGTERYDRFKNMHYALAQESIKNLNKIVDLSNVAYKKELITPDEAFKYQEAVLPEQQKEAIQELNNILREGDRSTKKAIDDSAKALGVDLGDWLD